MVTQILLCESEPMIGEMISDYLSPLGFKVTFANSETRCLEIIDKRIPDVVILDTHMAQSDSRRTVRKIREKGIKTPVLLLSSDYGITSHTDAVAMGANGFLEKPLRLKDLLTQVVSVMS